VLKVNLNVLDCGSQHTFKVTYYRPLHCRA
jgi:hypothetical protein